MISAFQEGIDTSLFFGVPSISTGNFAQKSFVCLARLTAKYLFLQGSMILTILTKKQNPNASCTWHRKLMNFEFFLRFLGILDAEFYPSWVKMSRYSNDIEGISRILFDLCFIILLLIRKPHNWSNYSDLTRPGPPLFRKMGPLIPRKSSLVKYYKIGQILMWMSLCTCQNSLSFSS